MRERILRTVIPDGTGIELRREELGLTQEDLAGKSRLSTKTIRNLASGNPCFRSSLQAIAPVLRREAKELEAGPRLPRKAVLADAVAAAQAGLATADAVLFRLLDAIELSHDAGQAELEVLLVLAERRDVEGDARGAARLGRLVLQSIGSQISHPLYARAIVRTAKFTDHAGNNKVGRRLLVQLFKRYESKSVRRDPDYWWAMCHMGILVQRAGRSRLKTATEILRKVFESAPLRYRIAAWHQLGVIDLRRRMYASAEQKFLRCLEDRRESCDDYRVAYEYRRLGEVYARTGRPDEAAKAFLDAEAVVARWSFQRYTAILRSARLSKDLHM